ncbi:CvpA family protein [uncultured Solobacterium sp.]|jgi:colicin V production protein|uniref:CvpA family protein n=1 Tax=uncultured Solobacterium sp. TaxID=747375 RepID=UPI0025D23D99|nr:CvpA family protein [uncultured Solobacterium sp.]
MFTLQENWAIYFSAFVVIFFILKAAQGYNTGILRRLIGLVGSIISYWIAWILCGVFAKYINIISVKSLGLSGTPFEAIAKTYVNQIAWFILLFLVLRILFFVVDRIAKGVHKVPGLHAVSALLGAAFGVLEAFVWMVVITVLLHTPLFKNGSYIVENSLIKQVNQVTEMVAKDYLGPLFSSEGFSKMEEDTKSLTDLQRNAVENWLKENGFVEESKQIK